MKGGGGVMAYVSSSLSSKKLKLPRNFEALALESKFGRHDAIVLGIYRPPKAVGKDYYNRLESDLNDIISWESLQRQLIVGTGDLNMDRLKPARGGYFRNFWVGMCRWDPGTLSLYQS